MPTTTPESPDATHASTRVKAYFRSLGMPAGPRLDEAARAVLARVLADYPHAHGAELGFAAMNEARRVVRKWMLRLVEAGHLPEPTTMTTGLIVWRLRHALARHPEAFLAVEDLPADFVQAISGPSPVILPQALPGQMEAQPFQWRSFRLPPKVARHIQRLNNATHDLILTAVAGR